MSRQAFLHSHVQSETSPACHKASPAHCLFSLSIIQPLLPVVHSVISGRPSFPLAFCPASPALYTAQHLCSLSRLSFSLSVSTVQRIGSLSGLFCSFSSPSSQCTTAACSALCHNSIVHSAASPVLCPASLSAIQLLLLAIQTPLFSAQIAFRSVQALLTHCQASPAQSTYIYCIGHHSVCPLVGIETPPPL